jgi:hypothetical protein
MSKNAQKVVSSFLKGQNRKIGIDESRDGYYYLYGNNIELLVELRRFKSVPHPQKTVGEACSR